jgi:hypothetical protein
MEGVQMTKDRRIERELRSCKHITTSRIQARLRSAEKGIQEDLEAGDPESALFGAATLATPTIWRGERSIARGDDSGWNDVLEYCWTCLAIYEKGGIRASSSAGDVAPALLMRLAVEGWSSALKKTREGLDKLLKKLRGDDRDEVHLAYFASFVAELMATGKARPRGPKGPLRRLSAEFCGRLTTKTINDACEFQLRNSGATEEDGVEFVNFSLNPVWWFALLRARKQLGLETPIPEHPLFSTPFAKLPDGLAFDPKKSSLLKRVDEIAKALK